MVNEEIVLKRYSNEYDIDLENGEVDFNEGKIPIEYLPIADRIVKEGDQEIVSGALGQLCSGYIFYSYIFGGSSKFKEVYESSEEEVDELLEDLNEIVEDPELGYEKSEILTPSNLDKLYEACFGEEPLEWAIDGLRKNK